MNDSSVYKPPKEIIYRKENGLSESPLTYLHKELSIHKFARINQEEEFHVEECWMPKMRIQEDYIDTHLEKEYQYTFRNDRGMGIKYHILLSKEDTVKMALERYTKCYEERKKTMDKYEGIFIISITEEYESVMTIAYVGGELKIADWEKERVIERKITLF
jgi:hypothetical protein